MLRGVVVVAGLLLALVVAGCAAPVIGEARADPDVAASIARERGCDSAVDDIVVTVETFIRRIDSDPSALQNGEEIAKEVPAHDLGRNLGLECGRGMAGSAYSTVLVRVQDLSPGTGLGRIAHNAVLGGLCRVDAEELDLEAQARVVCAGR